MANDIINPEYNQGDPYNRNGPVVLTVNGSGSIQSGARSIAMLNVDLNIVAKLWDENQADGATMGSVYPQTSTTYYPQDGGRVYNRFLYDTHGATVVIVVVY